MKRIYKFKATGIDAGGLFLCSECERLGYVEMVASAAWVMVINLDISCNGLADGEMFLKSSF